MPRKSAELPESAFWKRLVDAFKVEGLPTSQNGVAKKMGMSQGTIQAWVRGESLPTMENAVKLAGKGRVCVQWLLTGEPPRRPGPQDPLLAELIEVWETIRPDRQERILEFARFVQRETWGPKDGSHAPDADIRPSHPERLPQRQTRK